MMSPKNLNCLGLGNSTDMWLSSVCPNASSKTWATAWPLHQWTSAGNVPSLQSDTTSSSRRHESGCGTHTPAASTKSDCQPGWGQDCWLATELHGVMKSGFLGLTVAWSRTPGGQARCPVEIATVSLIQTLSIACWEIPWSTFYHHTFFRTSTLNENTIFCENSIVYL